MTITSHTGEPLWTPTAKELTHSKLAGFSRHIQERYHCHLPDYPALHRWSCENLDCFWTEVAKFTHLHLTTPADPMFKPGAEFITASWGHGATLNFTKNLVEPRGVAPTDTAIISANEVGTSSSITFRELADEVGRMASLFSQLGVAPGDRICGVVPNQIPVVVAHLAAAQIGAVWSSCSPDFGETAILERFKQIEPTIFCCVTRATYQGKELLLANKITRVVAELPTLRAVLVLDPKPLHDEISRLAATLPRHLSVLDLSSVHSCTPNHNYPAFPFAHPLAILYSSGTTGKPKAIVHGTGGTLLQHMKEHQLHCNLGVGDRLLFYTTTGWMMWNWLISALASGITIVLYDGSPLAPSSARLWELVDEFNIHALGISPRYLAALAQANYLPREHHSLSSLRLLLSTGAPLLPSQFEWSYNSIKRDMQLGSISGGTDIISCFALCNPLQPVYGGELQGAGLGMDIAIFDDVGQSVIGTRGELVCRSPFPSMPLYFWNDTDNARYRQAYFDRFHNVWSHGDEAIIYHHGGVVIHGRSDAVLNPGGVRIGTGELYRVLDNLPFVLEAVAAPLRIAGDEEIVLLVKLTPNTQWDDEVAAVIRRALRTELSPRHVPAHIFQVLDLPRTINGKLSETSVRQIINGDALANLTAITNPEVIEEFEVIRAQLLACDLSIVIPALNETNRLPNTIASYRSAFELLASSLNLKKVEIIVVDDGSHDGTSELALSLSTPHFPIRIERHKKNRGKGAALHTGMRTATGSLILLADADGSTPLDELPKLLRSIQNGAHIAVGSRVLQDDGTVLKAKWHRKIIGSIFRALVVGIALNDLPDINVKDTQCGFKLLTAKAAKELLPHLQITGFSCDVEFLRVAGRLKFKVTEVAVSWQHVAGSRINLFTSPWRMFLDLCVIRLRHRGE